MQRQFALAGLLTISVVGSAQAEIIYGLTNLQELVRFDSATRAVTSTTSLPGFSIAGQFLVGIDVRPATGEIYGFSNQNNLFRINPNTGASTQVGSTIPGLTGSFKTIDFNPTVDRIRLLTSGNQNLRLHPDTGAVAFTDGVPAFVAGDANAGETPFIVNAAYTNSFVNATSTTLYTIEASNDILATQLPPNNGTQNTIGALGFDIASSGGFTGFDISGASGAAYLVGNNLFGGLTANALYSVNLQDGSASLLGPVSGMSGSFRDIAVAPEPTTLAALAGFALVALRRR